MNQKKIMRLFVFGILSYVVLVFLLFTWMLLDAPLKYVKNNDQFENLHHSYFIELNQSSEHHTDKFLQQIAPMKFNGKLNMNKVNHSLHAISRHFKNIFPPNNVNNNTTLVASDKKRNKKINIHKIYSKNQIDNKRKDNIFLQEERISKGKRKPPLTFMQNETNDKEWKNFIHTKKVKHYHTKSYPVKAQMRQGWENLHEWVNHKKHIILSKVGGKLNALQEVVNDLKPQTNFYRLSYTDQTSDSNNYSTMLPTYNTAFFHQTTDQKTFVYSVFYDDRLKKKFVHIVLLGLPKKQIQNRKISCIFSVTRDGRIYQNITATMSMYETCEPHNKDFSAYLGSCEVPVIAKYKEKSTEVGLNVSFIFIHFGLQNILAKINVINNFIQQPTFNNNVLQMDKPHFAVCVPPLFGNASAVKIMEFVEASRVFGAHHFIFYVENISKNLKKLLNYYKQKNIVTLMPWKLPIENKDIWYHGQSVSVWDCLFRTMNKFQYVIFQDYDELLVPRSVNTWENMVKHLSKGKEEENIAGFQFYSTFFSPEYHEMGASERNYSDLALLSEKHDIKAYQFIFNTLRFTQRTRKFDHVRTKLIINPLKVFELGIHHLSKPLKEEYKSHIVHPKIASIHHFRTCTHDTGMDCKNLITDNRLLHFKEKIFKGIKKTLKNLNKSYIS